MLFPPENTFPLKSFRFAAVEDNEIFEIPALGDYTAEEKSFLWLSDGDYDDIEQAIEQVVSAMEAGESIDPLSDTERGVEHRTEDGDWARFQAVRDVRNAVLSEQERQRNSGVNADDELVARASQQRSALFLWKARERGASDAMEARKTSKPRRSSMPELKSAAVKRKSIEPVEHEQPTRKHSKQVEEETEVEPCDDEIVRTVSPDSPKRRNSFVHVQMNRRSVSPEEKAIWFDQSSMSDAIQWFTNNNHAPKSTG